jgi:hypothetical protein
VRVGRVFQGLVLGFADGLLLWIPLATLFPAQMVGAYAAMAPGGAVVGGLIGAVAPRRVRTVFEYATFGCLVGYMTLVVVGAATNRAANLQLLVPLIMGGFVVGAMVGALDPFGRRGATDQDRYLAAARNDLLEAREVAPPDDALPGVTYQVSGFRTRAALEGAGAGEPDWDDEYEYDEIENARQSARTWLKAQGRDGVAHIMRLVDGSEAKVVERIRLS